MEAFVRMIAIADNKASRNQNSYVSLMELTELQGCTVYNLREAKKLGEKDGRGRGELVAFR
jgi:hypothetical protein